MEFCLSSKTDNFILCTQLAKLKFFAKNKQNTQNQLMYLFQQLSLVSGGQASYHPGVPSANHSSWHILVTKEMPIAKELNMTIPEPENKIIL